MSVNRAVSLRTSRDRLTFDAASGRLVSLRPLHKPGCELVESAPADPAFIIQYLDESRAFREISSTQASAVSCQAEAGQLVFAYTGLAGLDLSASVTVRVAPDDRYSHWALELTNRAGLRVAFLRGGTR